MSPRRYGVALVAVIACALVLVLAPGTAAAQDVRVEGKVTWIAAETMVVAPAVGFPITVDLSQVDLDQYRALQAGDRVIVTGRLEGNRLVATSIQVTNP